MATVVVKRPSRRPSPELPSGELLLDAPPEIPAPTGRQMTPVMYMVPMFLMLTMMMLMFSRTMSGPLRYAIFALFGAFFVVMIILIVIMSGAANKKEMGYARRQYLRKLAQNRVRLQRTIVKQREAMEYLHPAPQSLWALIPSYRLWERRVEDPDFLVTRVGVGRQSPSTRPIPPETKPLEQLEPLSALALRRFLKTYTAVPDMPLALALNGFARIYLRGDRDRTLGLARAMIAQLACLQAPDDVRIAVCSDEDAAQSDWEWVKWLPHAQHPERTDAAGPVRLVATSVAGIEAMLDDMLANRPRFDPNARRSDGAHVVVVIDGGTVAGSDHLMSGPGLEGVTIIDLTSAPPRALDRSALVLDIGQDGRLTANSYDGETELGTADQLDVVTAEGIARQLAPLRLTGVGRGEGALSASLDLAELLDIGDPYTFDPAKTWVQRPNREKLRVMFGVQSDGTPIELDLKESAQDGMGPHGVLIGATGSGKSELLRTLVLALAVTHPPNSLNFALIDFKGGATFTRLDRLPHTSAVITNLEEELHLVDRMTDAINGELVRRQELLRAAGKFSSLRDYEKARAAGAPLEEVPVLLVVIDEFSELLSAKPDFIDTFVQIGRVGRSLGVHLLLASQRLDEGRLRGLEAHLSYRIGLRTFSAMDSRAVLGVTDAYELPRAPGHGFLQFGVEPMTRFRSAYVSGVYRRTDQTTGNVSEKPELDLLDYTTHYQQPSAEEDDEPAEDIPDDDAVGESLLDVLTQRLEGKGKPAHQVWLPPLEESPTLDQLLQPLAETSERGLCTINPHYAGQLRPVVGIVDRPFEQRRDPQVLDLTGAGGHVLVLGGPHSGKSTALRTLMASLALSHTPREVQMYAIDFGGGTLSVMRGLPHVGGVAGRQNPGAVRRTIAEVLAVLDEREKLFAEHEIDGMASFRAARARGEFADHAFGDVFLIIDGWGAFAKEHDAGVEQVQDLVARGLSYGIHVVLSVARSFELRMQMRDMFGSLIELKLGDPIDSMIDRVAALSVPDDSPGRGVSMTKHQMLVGLPRVDGVTSDQDLQAATMSMTQLVANSWQRDPAPSVRVLPGQVDNATLPADEPSDGSLPLTVGLAERDLGPVQLDFLDVPHCLLLGDTKAGKTNFIRTVARRIVDTYSPKQARIVLLDYRRGLLGEVPDSHLVGYGSDFASARSMAMEIAEGLATRRPGPDVTPEQLRNRNWWSGPELFLLIDDYDLVVPSLKSENPLAPLLDYLPQGRELGFHVVLARRSGGAGRAMFEMFLARLVDIGSTGFLMSAQRTEGPLLGVTRPETLPPGRARIIRRGEDPELMQLSVTPSVLEEG